MSVKRNREYRHTLHSEASLIVSVLGLFNERSDSAANHMFRESWSGLRNVAMHLCDEIAALREEQEEAARYGADASDASMPPGALRTARNVPQSS